MRTTLTIEDDVIEAARVLARDEGVSIGEVVSRLARRGIRDQGRVVSEPGAEPGKDGLPVFDLPEDAAPITSETVARAMDE